MRERSTVRLGELAAPLAKRTESESKIAGRRVTHTDIQKRALRAYLNGENAHIVDAQAIINELDKLRRDLSRVGGNLNQIAHIFNMESRVDGSDLKKKHEALQTEFRQIASMLRQIQDELYKRK